MKGRWKGDLYVLDGSIVGTVQKMNSENWFAYGCMTDWEDTKIGIGSTREKAKQYVEEWVEENQ